MNLRLLSLTFISTSLLFAGCSGGSTLATEEFEAASLGHDVQPVVAPPVVGVRVVQITEAARVLELLDGKGNAVARYYPGFFSAIQWVPDVKGETVEMIAQKNKGTYFLDATINPRTGVVAVAVRSFIYAETSFDAVYRIDTRGQAFASSPYRTGATALLPFDGRTADGTLPTATDVTRAFISIEPSGLSYDGAGRLTVRAADASGALTTIVYNPDGRVFSCEVVGGEGRRCPAT